ncbi:hypothetical protein BH11ACT2_BH11ACT2_10790 [soil metagenome]
MTDLPPAPEPTPNVAPPAYAQPTGQAPVYGQPYAPGYVAPARTNTLAIVSLVLSLVGVGIGGIITGHIALGQIKTSGESGRGLALAGTIIGYVACGLVVLWGIFVVIAVIIATAGAASSGTY